MGWSKSEAGNLCRVAGHLSAEAVIRLYTPNLN